MKISIANPIYDVVFKYLMEDERIAKTILSALLKKEVRSVALRRNEYSNTSRDSISIFRLDFNATVVEQDGSERLILVELQKTWLETETLRFRQYLGAQYSQSDNIIIRDGRRYGLPMVAVYILGHRVGDIDKPVIYVKHDVYDYNGEKVTEGIPDPFVESLIHDSIIVQIPLLKNFASGRLAKVLSIFDQSRKDKSSEQLLNVDESAYDGDNDMEYIVHRLTSAAADTELRQNMNVEDEYFSAIEERDTQLMQQEKTIKEQAGKLEEQAGKLEEQSNTIRSAVAALKKTGMTVGAIASTLGVTVDEIRKYI